MNKSIMIGLVLALALVPLSAYAEDQVFSFKTIYQTHQIHVGDNIKVINDDTRSHSIVGKFSNGDSINTGTISAGSSTGFGFSFAGNFTFSDGVNGQKGTIMVYDIGTPFPILSSSPVVNITTTTPSLEQKPTNNTVSTNQTQNNQTVSTLPSLPTVSSSDTNTLVQELHNDNVDLTNQLSIANTKIISLQSQLAQLKAPTDNTDYKALYLQWKDIAMAEFKILSQYLTAP